MNKETIYIYVDPQEDIDTYPAALLDDMSVFKGFRTEVQWVFYLLLKNQGVNVEICRAYPHEGIFVIHKGNARRFIWRPNLFVLSLQWDYPRDDRGNIHMVSNRYKTIARSMGWLDRFSFQGLQCYVPPVMHPVVTPRNPDRGDRFENVAFMGDPKNLDDAFKTESFRDRLQALGLNFIIQEDPHRLADFSDMDAVIAVRKIGKLVTNKPPVKLINAWRGGVPALVGCEVGFREARENEFDYIEVDSADDAVTALKRLKEDLGFRRQMIANAAEKARGYTAEAQQKYWADFVRGTVIPAYREWRKKPALSRNLFLLVRWVRHQTRERLSYLWHRILKRRSRDYSSSSRMTIR